MTEKAEKGLNRREFLRTCGRVAAVGAIAAVAAALLVRRDAAARMVHGAAEGAGGSSAPSPAAERYPAGICVNDSHCGGCPAASDCPVQR